MLIWCIYIFGGGDLSTKMCIDMHVCTYSFVQITGITIYV